MKVRIRIDPEMQGILTLMWVGAVIGAYIGWYLHEWLG